MVKRNFSRVKTQCILSFVLKELCRFTAFTFRTSLLVISASLEYLCFHVSDQFSYQPQIAATDRHQLLSIIAQTVELSSWLPPQQYKDHADVDGTDSSQQLWQTIRSG